VESLGFNWLCTRCLNESFVMKRKFHHRFKSKEHNKPEKWTQGYPRATLKSSKKI
jgi:hypothetical protein